MPFFRLAGKNLKPYQGLKLVITDAQSKKSIGRKKPKTLSGIETWQQRQHHQQHRQAGKNLKPYQGLKHHSEAVVLIHLGRKKPKTLSGIETITT